MADTVKTALVRGVDAPLVVEDAERFSWDDAADVVVVGFGGAGAAAAIEARQRGADVIALDRYSGGGATAYSGGIIYSGGGTSIQREAGFEDSVEELEKYLELEVGNVVSRDTLKRFCAESPETITWLQQLGVPFEGTPFPDKTAYPPDGYHLYYSGNEAIAPYKLATKPVMRGHRAVGPGMGGAYFFEALRKAADKIGVRFFRHSPVVRLIMDPKGDVIGVETLQLSPAQQAEHQRAYDKVIPMRPFMSGVTERQRRAAKAIEDKAERRLRIRARQGVILSTGGFVNNIEMLQRHAPSGDRNYAAMLRMGSLGCDGSGVELAQSAGGTLALLDQMMLARNLSPPAAFLDGIIVNRLGERFVNESIYSGHVGRAIEQQPGGDAWLIMSGQTMWQAIREIFTSGWLLFKFSGPSLLNILFGGTKRGANLDKLARKCGIDAQGLRNTVRAYNRMAAENGVDPLGKSSKITKSIGDGPYYAVNYKISNNFAFNMIFTLGGAVVDEASGEVKRADGRPVRGLYAAGRTAVGICSNYYVSGLSISDAVFSGRRAARHAVGRASSP